MAKSDLWKLAQGFLEQFLSMPLFFQDEIQLSELCQGNGRVQFTDAIIEPKDRMLFRSPARDTAMWVLSVLPTSQ